jgi:hypothetical protein
MMDHKQCKHTSQAGLPTSLLHVIHSNKCNWPLNTCKGKLAAGLNLLLQVYEAATANKCVCDNSCATFHKAQAPTEESDTSGAQKQQNMQSGKLVM